MKPSKKLTLKQIEKFARLVKTNTQVEAVEIALHTGIEFSVDEAKLVGIADPKRVIYNLRQIGLRILCDRQTTKTGSAVYRYSLAPKTSTRRTRVWSPKWD